MNIVSVVGFIAGTLTTVAFLPQTIRILRTKRAIDISLGLCFANTGAAIFWTIYGVTIGMMPVIITNGVGSIVALSLLVSKLKYGMKEAESAKVPLLAVIPFISVIPSKFFVGGMAMILGVSAFLPQVIRAWELKETKDISLTAFLTLWVGIIIWLVYGFLIADSVIIINNAINLSLVSTILVLKAKYK